MLRFCTLSTSTWLRRGKLKDDELYDAGNITNTNVKVQAVAYCKKYGLHREMVEPSFREPYIITGYRQPNMKAVDCFKSAFVLYCNETFNVWTHFVAFLCFAGKFTAVFTSELSLRDTFVWPLLSNAIGICGFCLMSSCAHMFNSVSAHGRHACFFMDYAAISIFSFGVGQACYFYARPIDRELPVLSGPFSFGLISLLLSVVSTTLCCTTRIKWHGHKHSIRAGAFVIPYLLNSVPYLHRMIFCTSVVDCQSSSFPWFWLQALFAAFAGGTYASHFPERYLPGLFDCFGHSHHFMHIFTALGAAVQFHAARLDMVSRQDSLLQAPSQATFWNSLFLMQLAVAINIAIALGFGKLAREIECRKAC